MALWTLADIQQEVRRVSGRRSVSEVSNDQLTDIINRYTQYEFPAEVKLDRNESYYVLNLTANQQNYTVPETYTNFDGIPWVDNWQVPLYLEPDQFYNYDRLYVTYQTPQQGDGVTTVFTGSFNPLQILFGSIIISNDMVGEPTLAVGTDSPLGLGSITGPGVFVGTINYATGFWTITFNNPPPLGSSINASYEAYQASRPQSVLYFNNQFTFYPIPDKVYRFRIKAWSVQTVVSAAGVVQTMFINPDDRPLKDQWGLAIAYGATRRLQLQFGETDAYAETTVLYKEQIAYVMNRTLVEMINTRTTPSF